MAAAVGRDPQVTKHVLESWLRDRLRVDHVEVDDLVIPRAGFSNETILGVASWRDGGEHARPFVLRIGATSHRLYMDNDVMRQADVMHALAGRVPVPRVWLREEDSRLLGAPFFLMDRIRGRTPPDLPSWHKRGWVADLSASERLRLYDNGLVAMAALHAVDWPGTFAFLDVGGRGTALDRYLAHVQRWYEWCRSAIDVDADSIESAITYVVDEQPDDHDAAISWGDARVGNIIYADDLSVAALVDWEGASIAPRALDLGWWLMFEDYLSDAQGIVRLDGVPGREATIGRYEQLTGTSLVSIAYYEVLAGLVFALINSRLFELLIARGQADRSTAEVVIGRITAGIRRSAERA